MSWSKLAWREVPEERDRQAVRSIIESSGFFYPAEVDVAVELVEERLARGLESGYHFLFAEQDGQVVGYTCYGPIPCTLTSFDLYWIAVHEIVRGQKLGRLLLERTEQAIAERQPQGRIYVETSGRPQYEPTRSFYLHCGYRIEATLEEFYGPGDPKVILVKVVGR